MAATQQSANAADGLRDNSPAEADFPFRTYLCRFPFAAGRGVNWHWHNEIELCRVRKGRLRCHTGGAHLVIEEGQCVFVNACVLHMFEPEPGCEGAQKETVLFSPALITEPGSALWARYVEPLAGSRALPLFALRGDEPWQAEAQALFDEIYRQDRTAFGWELTCRGLVSRLWLLLVESLADKARAVPPDSVLVNEQRAKKMLAFIQKVYLEDLTIDAIAGAASVSRSECFRCFRRVINKKPIEYLTEYRIERAVDLLLHTDLNITDICYQCGFSSPSYFGKVFRNMTGLPPRTYRRQWEETAESTAE